MSDIVDVNKAKEKVPQKALGFVGLKSSSGFVEEEFLQALRWPDAARVYQEMSSNDAVIGGCLFLLETMLRRARWKVEPASTDAGDIEAAQFLESCMYDMKEQPWDSFICEVLSMLIYGFSFHEIIYKVRRGPLEKDPKFKSDYTDGKIGWQELPGRSQASLSEWTIDEATGKATEFIQDPGTVGINADKIKIPLEGNLLFRTKNTRGNPEGWSLLRRAYRSWYFKKYIEELEGIGVERNLAGIPLLQPDESTDLFDKNNPEMVQLLNWATQLVNDLRQDRNHGVIIPFGWELKLLGTEGGSKTVETDVIIRRHESRMAMSMLSDLVLIGSDRTGSFALAETKQSLFIAALQAIITSIASTLNTNAVPKLFAVNNWTLEKLPKITADSLEEPDLKEVALILRSFKIDITKNQKLMNFLLNLMQAPTLDETEFKELMTATQADNNNGEGDGNNDDDPQDTAENDAKQSGEAYV